MRVYFTASVAGGRKYVPQFKLIYNTLFDLGHDVWGKHITNHKLASTGEKLSAKQIFEREKKKINWAEAAVIDVTTPSTGTGMMVSYALSRGKPVLALFYREAEDLLSSMIAGNPSDNLYLEHYDEDNLKIILKNFLEHVKARKEKRGRLIVIDGADGSGKQTQTKLLFSYLREKGPAVKYYDFPRYYTSFHGRMVGRFLAGEFGQLNEISPYLASLAYALDRASVKDEMDEWLGKGGIIVSNRYATSSMAHQAARLSRNKRSRFIDWLDELEYKVHKIPREDLVIYLYVPWKIGLELSKKKGKRGYLNGEKLDIAEVSIKHRQEVEKMYLWLAKNRKNWVRINCCQNGKIRSRQDIHQEILKVLEDKKII